MAPRCQRAAPGPHLLPAYLPAHGYTYIYFTLPHLLPAYLLYRTCCLPIYLLAVVCSGQSVALRGHVCRNGLRNQTSRHFPGPGR
jgi:hypothetical protein